MRQLSSRAEIAVVILSRLADESASLVRSVGLGRSQCATAESIQDGVCLTSIRLILSFQLLPLIGSKDCA